MTKLELREFVIDHLPSLAADLDDNLEFTAQGVDSLDLATLLFDLDEKLGLVTKDGDEELVSSFEKICTYFEIN